MDNQCIYEIISPSGKRYIGRTRNFNKRMIEHKCHSNYPINKRKFYDAIFKYGWDNFEKRVIEYVSSEEEAIKMEKYYIEKYDTVENGYNHSNDSEAGGDNWSLLSDERKEKIRYNMRKRMKGKNNPMFGKQHSDDTRKKQKDKAKGRFSLEWYIDRNGEEEGRRLYDERRTFLKNRNLKKDKKGRFIPKK